MILNKVDLLPYVTFDVAKCIAYARQINPSIEVIELSATRGTGLEDGYSWVRGRMPALMAVIAETR